MRTTAALFASGLGALALIGAGCGGSGTTNSGSASGSVSGSGGSAAGTVQTSTTNSQGGVAGAQVNIDQQKLRQEANKIQNTLNTQLNKLQNARSPKQVGNVATTLRSQLLQASNRLDKLNIQNPKLQQQRGALESGLRSAAADLTTLQADVKSGSLTRIFGDLGNLSTLTQIRRTIAQIQQTNVTSTAKAEGQQALANHASSLQWNLQSKLLQLRTVDNAKMYNQRLGQLEQYLTKEKQQIQSIQVPSSLQSQKNALLTFVDNWNGTIQHAQAEAQNGNLSAARQTMAKGSLGDLQKLVSSLTSSSTSATNASPSMGGTVTPTAPTATATTSMTTTSSGS